MAEDQEKTGGSPEPSPSQVPKPADEDQQQSVARAADPSHTANAPVCDLCGAVMLERHCKMVCTQCGYMRDCSDP